ncbi:unnamed protein product [Parnassius apollo]|uniref:(apollo) hypothetical protein n=1 Tax=Parnassius apollo TaxID=110799 RepID=A0A8S3Y3D9_PARAO|nr:unnamed protein product [Parnassius apollo]
MVYFQSRQIGHQRKSEALTPVINYASRKSTATSPLSLKQAESGCREGSEPNAGYLFGSQPGPLRDGLNSFGAALAVCRIIGAKLSTPRRATGQSSAIPAWRIRIEERIAKARALIGRLICFRSGNTRPRIVRTVRMAFAGTNVSLSQPDITQKLTERIDDLKQKIAAWGKRIRRYTERSTRFNQNRLFQSDQKRLCKSLERPMVSGTGPAPNQADTVAFWRSLWSEPVNLNEGPWTEVVARQCAGITPMDPVIITPDDVAEAVRRAPNWKSPELDGRHQYWLKGFMVCHAVLARQFQEALSQNIATHDVATHAMVTHAVSTHAVSTHTVATHAVAKHATATRRHADSKSEQPL